LDLVPRGRGCTFSKPVSLTTTTLCSSLAVHFSEMTMTYGTKNPQQGFQSNFGASLVDHETPPTMANNTI
jgi:hypothetical protein